MENQVVVRGERAPVPGQVAAAGEGARKRFIEFFTANIRNRNTRAAYLRAVSDFFEWCAESGLRELSALQPVHVAAYVESLGKTHSAPSVKQHLAAVRMLFDWLVVGQVVAGNPASVVRGPKHVVKRGKTPVLVPEEAHALFESIPTHTLVGLRDRALLAVLIYSFARISAALAMRVEDYFPQGKRWWLRLHEKGGNITKCRRTIRSRSISTATSERRGSARIRFSSENFANSEPTKTELEKFLDDFIKFYTRVMISFAKEHEDQLGFVNFRRESSWEEGDLADLVPRLDFPEIVVFFEARGLCYSKIIGCLRALIKQKDILCDEGVYYAKPSEHVVGGTRTRIRKSAEFLPSPKHTVKIPELKNFTLTDRSCISMHACAHYKGITASRSPSVRGGFCNGTRESTVIDLGDRPSGICRFNGR